MTPNTRQRLDLAIKKRYKTSSAPTLTDLIYIKRNFLSREQCNVIIDEFESSPLEAGQEQCRHAVTDILTRSTFITQDSQIGTDSFKLIHSTIETMINDYHDYLDTFESFHVMRRGSSMLHPHKYRIMKYEKGAWIHPHVDHDMGIYGSCTINLNEEYEGGDFAFWNGKHKIKLGVGDVMIWPADYFWVHEVEEITNGIRYSANTFLCRHPIELPKEVKYNIRQPT
jgi:hypothetical protein|tara:strand:+ start:1546 stop:2223 length:678 start_codon:yes stop_codon:yes gene_type:complete